MNNNGHEIPRPELASSLGGKVRSVLESNLQNFFRSLDHEVVLRFVVESVCALVKFYPAERLTFAPAGLPPAEHRSVYFTHNVSGDSYTTLFGI